MSVAFSWADWRAEQKRAPVQEHDDDERGDSLTRDGAIRLKQAIEYYWLSKGYAVEVKLISVGFHPAIRENRYDVRSDLLNGRPKNWKPSPK